MKSVAELEALRKKALGDINLRKEQNGFRVVVGMATCGIAAGARPVMASFVEELRKRNIDNVTVTMTGCIGVCRLEPVVEVFNPDGTKVTYVRMDSEKAVRVVAEHLVNGKPCVDLAIGEAEK